ncbi:MAG: cadmium-translocating P-type ATPase [Flavobacteriales bacterium]|nr:cadmium-translocating P-type ATPase [Flavobacteriales bacterium]
MPENHVSLQLEGMTCTHCSETVNGIICQEGGDKVHVDYLMGEATFELSDQSKLKIIEKRLESAGYETLEESIHKKTRLSTIEKKFLFTLPFSLVLFSHMFMPSDSFLNIPLVQLFLCLPVFALGFFHFGQSTIQALRVRSINMDILILLGSTSAFIYSLFAFRVDAHHAHDFLFFETTSTIISLVLLGYVIEHRAVKKTTAALKSLINHQPSKAKRLVQNGLNQDLEVVNASSLSVGDQVLINIGDTVPVDGIIRHGNVEVDQSMMTGESDSVFVGIGERVLSGSVVVNGSATLKTSSDHVNSTLGQIINLAKESRLDKPDIQKLSDQISKWFVPTILILSALSFLLNNLILGESLTESLLRSIAVLVISCPCAMGLATPTAVSVGLGVANRLGIIIKKASFFEVINAVEAFAFDKTGTLTTGQMNFELIRTSNNFTKNDVGAIIKSLESRSSHPIAQSLVKQFDAFESVNLEDFEEIIGEGVQAKTQFGKVTLGKSKNPDADLELRIDDEEVAHLIKSEELKEGAGSFINGLKKSGKRVYLLSGDSESKTSTISNELGFDTYRANMSPKEKLDFLDSQMATETVAMIGDGINDAPALSKATIGIAMGLSNAISSKAAGIVLLSTNVNRVERLLQISSAVVRTIKQNLFWAFSYNIVAIPLAALGYLDPMVAALSMAFSDVVVIGNSIRLRYTLSKKFT